MKSNNVSDQLIVSALKNSAASASPVDFTRRVMERIAAEAAARERRENRMLLFGAILCGVGLLSLGAGLLIYLSAGGVSMDWKVVPKAIEPLFVAETDYSLWCYLALTFLVLALAQQLLLRLRHEVDK